MKKVEKLDWILDKKKNRLYNNEEMQQNIEFVHSLGLKCDCVGWSKLDLQSPRADEILTAIDSFCKKEGWNARGWYTRSYSDYSSEWYELCPTAFKDNTICDINEIKNEYGEKNDIYSLRAYHELRVSPKWWGSCVFVPGRFRNACIRHNINDVDFCWAEDKGKYAAEQYFHIYGNRLISRVATGKHIEKDNSLRIETLGGFLPKISRIFYDIHFDLQDCYLSSEMPDCSIAYTCFDYKKPKFLIKKDFVEILLKEKAISENDLRCVPVIEQIPDGYELFKTVAMDRPAADILKQSIEKYEKLKDSVRPEYRITEKDALSMFKIAKKERKEDFQRGLRKKESSEISITRFAPVLPYYLISNGCFFSDEYRLLPYDEAVKETEAFFDDLISEELLENKPDGTVIAKCPCGDRIILCDDERAVRFSHEEPAIIDEWDSLPKFVVDALNS